MRIPIARPGYIYVALSIVLTVLLYLLSSVLFVILLLLTVFTVYFFRDPYREPPAGDNLLLAPADGRVMKVEKIHEPYFINGEAQKISIFLSLFDVHINRSPFGGTVPFCRHIQGRYLAAFKEEAPRENERNLIGIETEEGRMLVVQVAGMVARRIVCWIKPGDLVERGARIGMIKFGSCTELYMPLHANITVKEGEKVRGGETIVAQF